MPDYKDEVESRFNLSDGDKVTVKDVEMIYREGPPSGYFYSLDSIDKEFKVLTSQRSISQSLHLAVGNWSKIGLNNYLEKMETSELIYPGEGDYPPQPSFKSPEVEEELRSLAERFLEE